MNQFRQELDRTVVETSVPPLGHVPVDRSDGVFRLMSVQLNSISTSKSQNEKTAKLQYLVKKYDIELIGMAEVGVNWSLAKHGKRLLSIFPQLERTARSSTAYNVHERHGIHQQGGVGFIARGGILQYFKKGMEDFRHLGRWDSVLISRDQYHRTQVVHVYGVRPERSENVGSVYQQHVRYMQEHNIVGY